MTSRVPSKVLEGLLLSLLAFGPLAFGCVEPWSRAALEVACFLLAFLCWARGSRSSSTAWLVPAGFAVLGALQLANSSAADAPRPLGPFTAAPHETRQAIVLWAAYAALLWSVPRVVITHRRARRFMKLLFWLGAGVAALGLLQNATGSGDSLYWLRDASRGRPFGPYYNGDDAANLLLMSLCAGAGLLWSTKRRWPWSEGPDPDYVRTQSRLLAGAAVILAGMAACGSRGAFLALPLTAAAMVFLGRDFARSAGARALRIAGALCAAGCVALMAVSYLQANFDAGVVVEWPIRARLMIYGDAWRWFKDAPWFGTGLGSFATVYPSYQDSGVGGSVMHAHSDWIELALETGLLGLAAALAASLGLAGGAAREWRRAKSGEMRGLIGGALAAAAAFAAHVLLDFCFQIPGNAVVFIALAGFLASAPSWSAKDGAPDKGAPRPIPAALAGAAALVLAAGAAVRPEIAAWRAADPSTDTAASARAFAVEQDPRYLHRLAVALYDRSAGDPALLRAALGYSSEVLRQRPFSAADLALAGDALVRLRRPADGRDLLEKARRVRFERLEGAP